MEVHTSLLRRLGVTRLDLYKLKLTYSSRCALQLLFGKLYQFYSSKVSSFDIAYRISADPLFLDHLYRCFLRLHDRVVSLWSCAIVHDVYTWKSYRRMRWCRYPEWRIRHHCSSHADGDTT